MAIVVRMVEGKSGLRDFIAFPFELFKDSALWVPPIINNELNTLDPAQNPSQKTSPARFMIAYRDKKAVGRIAAIAMHTAKGIEGRFGWFDVIDDIEVTKALFAEAEKWLKQQGANQIKGPMGFTNLDRAGMLIEGFDELPTTATIYNYPYYNDHLLALGFSKSVDYVEYEFTVPDIPEKVTAFMDVIAKRYKLHLLDDPSGKKMMSYGQQLFDLINETHRNLYGFKLLSDEMKEYYIKKYVPFIKPAFVAMVLDENDKLVAYGLTMPSYARAFQQAKGRLFPFGFWHILRAAKRPERADLLLIGVADQYRNKGVTSLIFHRIITSYKKLGVKLVESNPELEDNQQVQALWQKYEYRQHKRRRVYQKEI